MDWPFGTLEVERRQWTSHMVLSKLKLDNNSELGSFGFETRQLLSNKGVLEQERDNG